MPHDAWHDVVHLGAAAALIGGGAIFIALAAIARRRHPPARLPRREVADPARQLAPILTVLAVALAAGAAAIHLAAAPSHVEELGPLGWGFVAVALFQGAWAPSWLVKPSRQVAVVGALGSLAIAGAWAWTRTFGLPVGPLAGSPEPIGVPDVAATLFELLLVGLLAIRITGREGAAGELLRRAPSLPAIALVPILGVMFFATTLSVTVALGHAHGPADGHSHAEDAHAHGAPAGLSAEPDH
jgi:hypothetical protein